jgi:ubiquinone/menaquinone biosynthesis C-methylase UbiE
MCAKHLIFPIERADSLDNRIRRWFQNPSKILGPYVEEGMAVLDQGCGTGYFTIYLSRKVGTTGRVIASDLQEGMLKKLNNKIQGTELEQRIKLHKCKDSIIGLSERVDFVLACYVIHEMPDQEEFFREIRSILKPDGKILIIEPPFRVLKKEFEETIRKAGDAGFIVVGRPKVFLSKAALLKRINYPMGEM